MKTDTSCATLAHSAPYENMSRLETDCESIRENIKECGQIFITVAYKVYELHYYETYKEKYKNIVECCKSEFGFSKSTTYRLLDIVKTFGAVENGMITYNSVCRYNNYSYSQLSEMLSLSESQREKVTADTTVSEIRNIKKVPTSGKIKNSDNTANTNIIEVSPEHVQIVEKVTEKPSDNASSENKTIEDLQFKLKLAEERADEHWKSRLKQGETIEKYIRQVEELRKQIKILETENKNLKQQLNLIFD